MEVTLCLHFECCALQKKQKGNICMFRSILVFLLSLLNILGILPEHTGK